MPFPASALGLSPPPSRRLATTRSILAYAAGLGEGGRLDDSGDLTALPFQCVSFEWPVIVAARACIGDALTPPEAARSVHALQDSHFHASVQPGDLLETTAKLIEVRPVRAGVLTTYKLTTTNLRMGETAVTSYSSSIYRDVALDGAPRVLEASPNVPEGGLETARERVRFIPREAAHVYTECADIWNPIHTERAAAYAAGLPDIILHGTATWALAGLELVETYAQGELPRLRRLSGRFKGMVFPGETISIRHAPSTTDASGVHFEVITSDGVRAIDQGYALFSP